MAPLSPSNTPRLFIDYNTCGENHTMMIRYAASESTADAMVGANDFLTALSPGLRLITILGARATATGSNVSVPVTWSGAATYGGTAGAHWESAQYYDFVGRSNDGRRVRLAVFGSVNVQDGGDYRIAAGGSTVIEDCVSILNDQEGTFLTISGQQPRWKSYANIGENAYWRNHIRA